MFHKVGRYRKDLS
jgi:hypothetical protein